MSLADIRKKRRRRELEIKATDGNERSTVANEMLPRTSFSKRLFLDLNKKPYSCVICGTRLSVSDTEKLDQIFAEFGEVIRVMCSCHTGAMSNFEFSLMRQPIGRLLG